MTFVRENQIIPWQGVYFFTNTVYKIIETYTVVMKNMISTIGKKMCALVKENTPCCCKIYKAGMCFYSKGCIFLRITVFSSPLLCKYW